MRHTFPRSNLCYDFVWNYPQACWPSPPLIVIQVREENVLWDCLLQGCCGLIVLWDHLERERERERERNVTHFLLDQSTNTTVGEQGQWTVPIPPTQCTQFWWVGDYSSYTVGLAQRRTSRRFWMLQCLGSILGWFSRIILSQIAIGTHLWHSRKFLMWNKPAIHTVPFSLHSPTPTVFRT